MTKFEQVGVNLQHDAVSVHHANKNFKYSCDTCCARGMHIDCDRCAIATTHAMVVASMRCSACKPKKEYVLVNGL